MDVSFDNDNISVVSPLVNPDAIPIDAASASNNPTKSASAKLHIKNKFDAKLDVKVNARKLAKADLHQNKKMLMICKN